MLTHPTPHPVLTHHLPQRGRLRREVQCLRMRALFAAVLHVVQGIAAALQHKVVERNTVLLCQRRKFLIQVFGKPNGTGNIRILEFCIYLEHTVTTDLIFHLDFISKSGDLI